MESGDAHAFPEQSPEVVALVAAHWLFDFVDLGVDIESLAGPTDLLDVSQRLQWLVESLQRHTGSEALLEINGYPAYAVTTKDARGRYEYDVLILAQDIGRVAILEAISSPERWEDVLPIFEAIASSLTLFELEIEQVDPTLDELELPTKEDFGVEPFVNEEHGYQIAYPEGWLILDDLWQVSFSPDAAHSLCEESLGIERSECHTPIVMAMWIPDSDLMEEFDSLDSESDTLYLLELIAMQQTPGPTYVHGMLETLDVNGLPASGARFYGSDYLRDEFQPFRGYIVLVKGDTESVVIWTMAPTAVWQQLLPVFTAMLESFSITPVPPTETPDAGKPRSAEALLEQYQAGKRDFSGVELEGANLSGADLTEANLSRASLSGANLGRANLSGSDLSEADLSWVNLRGANLSGADLSGANLSGADPRGADLSGARLMEADLSGVYLPQAKLSGAHLEGAKLHGAILPWASLTTADLSGADLSEADLGRADLGEAVLFSADLSEANLGGADLNAADLSEADLSGADLTGAQVTEEQLAQARSLAGAIMPDPPTDMLGAGKPRSAEALLEQYQAGKRDFSDVELGGANLTGADLSEADLSGADLSGADLSEADLYWTDLRGADLSGADLNWAFLEQANLHGADLSEADLSEAELNPAYLSEADLHGADLRETSFGLADLTGADLHGANLSEAFLYFANLSGANLSGADLNWADLTGADLSGANLSGAGLYGADLSWADLSEADLAGADLSGAMLGGTDLTGADLSGAEVTDEQLAETASLEGATLPDGTVHE